MKELNRNSIELYDGELSALKAIKGLQIDSFEEPIHICDLSDIINKFYIWKTCMPRVTPFYAVKCNDHPFIIKTLAELGTGFDCASKGEINKVLGLGIESDRIIFANPTKPNSHIKHALESGVHTMTFDSDYELYKIQKINPQARLVIRIRCDAEKAQCQLGMKFGCDPEEDGPRLISLAKSLNLQIIGVSFHVGSGCKDYPVYERAIRAAKKLFNYAQSIGCKFNFLDIGGGFPGDKGTSLDEVSEIVNGALNKYFDDNDVTVISEPGRFFVSSAFTLFCKIHSKRKMCKDGLSDTMYFINDGVYGSFNCILYDHNIVKAQYISNNDSKLYKSSVWGPTCDGLDQIVENALLPKLDIGDVLFFENMGAYTVPIATQFNGFPLPRIKFFINNRDRKLRQLL